MADKKIKLGVKEVYYSTDADAEIWLEQYERSKWYKKMGLKEAGDIIGRVLFIGWNGETRTWW